MHPSVAHTEKYAMNIPNLHLQARLIHLKAVNITETSDLITTHVA